MAFRVIRHPEEAGIKIKNAVAALGNFDGMHVGHRKIIETAAEKARETGGSCVAVTFNPHPRLALKGLNPNLVCSFDERLNLMEQAGADAALVFRFDKDFAALTPERFVSEKLLDALDLKALLFGFNYRFGRGKEGDAEALKAFGSKYGFETIAQNAVTIGGAPVSSTRVREAITAGDLSSANELLGRRFSVSGEIVVGDKVGRTIGFPTANIKVEEFCVIPAFGVYAAEAKLQDGRAYPCALSVGDKPTFGGRRTFVEAHIIGFEGDIYGTRLRVEIASRIRGQIKFSGADALIERLKQDVEECRRLFLKTAN